jgi:hypothetical protein
MKTAVILVLTIALWTSIAVAQTGGAYSLSWNTLASGGGSVGSGAYVVKGAIGQPDVGRLTGGSYVINGGFWLPGGPGSVAVDPIAEVIPTAFAARVPAPNPFRESTVLTLELPAASPVRVAVYGIDGRLVRLLLGAERGAGRHRVVWNGLDDHGHAVSAGIYFARITAGTFTASHRIVRLD